ncbi:MAG: hypothetical protein K0R54_3966 [Clostridiaceae bacterium]|jgi:uncharacterized protein YxeA|nr:hypothetical protein [Clostridiaceae bacterium]
MSLGKPSIFSRDYERRMKKRRFTIIVVIIVIIIISALGSLYVKGKLFKVSNKNNTNKTAVNKNTNTSNKTQTIQKTPVSRDAKEEGYDLTLSDGKQIKAIFENKNNDKKFKYINPTDANADFTISPSGKSIVVLDKAAQALIYIDLDGNKTDISYNQYVSSSGTFTRGQVLQSKPDFIWCASPEFVDEENVAFISQLPWLQRSTKYIWMVNIKDKQIVQVQGISGESVKLDKITDKGLTVIADDKTLFLKGDKSITQ